MAKVGITGSQGFLGSHITKKFYDLGHDVVGTYNYTFPKEESKHRLNHFKLDITNFNECVKFINQENLDVVVHLVAQPLVVPATKHPLNTYELTIRGIYNLLDAIRQTGNPKAIIICTSDKVYGENGNAQELDRIDTTSTPYEVAKSCEDLIAQSYAKTYNLPIVIIRSANVYGGGDLHWDRLIPSTCKSIVETSSIVLRSNGDQKRDYLYVDDVVDGYVKVLDAFMSGKLHRGQAVNFGSERCYSAFDVVTTLVTMSEKETPIKILGLAQDELKLQHINFDLAKSIGWFPRTSLQDGLKKTLDWYKNYLNE